MKSQFSTLLKGSALILSLTVSSVATAAGGSGVALESPRIDQSNQKSLQRGAQVFANYCMGCHSAAYHRYGRLATDLGLSVEDVSDNLIFTTDDEGAPTKIGSLMEITMTEDYARSSFGVVPPNLALTARSRGVDWIYSYLKGFYLDPERGGVGVNNTVYPGAAMPHVLWDLQGWRKAIYEEVDGHKVITGFEQVTEGSMTPAEYDKTIADLTNFMAYLADPVKTTRHRIGTWVLAFLFVLLAISYFLKKEYWRDVT